DPVTLAMLSKSPLPAVVTVTSTVAVPPAGIDPSAQTTGALAEQLPWLGVADTSDQPVGRVSVSCTASLATSWVLRTVRVKDSVSPARRTRAGADWRTDRSGTTS